MKRTPLFIRIAGGVLFCALMLLSLAHPLFTQGECTAMLALSHRGKPYIFGAEGEDAFDCSGLTKFACAHFGVELIHSAMYVAYDPAYPEVEDTRLLMPGDLVFFDTVRDRDPYDHVGIWIGANRFVHASSSAGQVIISAFDENWRSCYSGARRIVQSDPVSAWKQLFRQSLNSPK